MFITIEMFDLYGNTKTIVNCIIVILSTPNKFQTFLANEQLNDQAA